jgi:hypothetical protein
MAAGERDHTDDWLVEPDRRPATVLELEERIDDAVRLAEAAETAALEIGAASLEAAEQARRAAALAESAAAASHAAAEAVASRAAAAVAPAAPTPPPAAASNGTSPPARPRRRLAQPDPFDARLTAFRDRADRIMVRLRRLDAAAPIS